MIAMMGDRNFRQIINSAIDNVGKTLDYAIPHDDDSKVHVTEVIRCLRRAFYDRKEPIEQQKLRFSNFLSGTIRKLEFGSKVGEYDMNGVKLTGQADIIADDVVIVFRSVEALPETMFSNDILYLNTCMFIFDKQDGVISYVDGGGTEKSFSLTRANKMFEEIARRVRVLTDLLKENKVPILEPSPECSTCQYYERCYIKKRESKPLSFDSLFGNKE